MEMAVPDLIMDRRLLWLGHVGRTEEGHKPKRLFGELRRKRPRHGSKKKCQDLIITDLMATGLDDGYQQCQEKKTWRTLCNEEEYLCCK